MYYLAVILFITSFITSLILIPLIRKFSIKSNFLDMPDEIKVHKIPMPLGGGIAIFLIVFIFLISTIIIITILKNIGRQSWIPDFIYVHLPGALSKINQLITITVCGMIIFVVGLIDDLKKLKARSKLLIEILIAEILFLNDIKITLFLPQNEIWGLLISNIISVLWIVGITNAFNLLDHMDGVSAGVAFISGTIFAFVGIQGENFFILAMLSVIVGSVAAFLIFNFPPAKIFMGDSGSLFIGYFFAVLSVIFTFYKSGYELYSVLVPVIVFIVPIFDTIWVSVIRIREGRSIFLGDKNHISHRLVRLGLTNRQAVFIIYILTFISGTSALMLYHLRGIIIFLPFVQIILLVIVLIIFETVRPKAEGD